MRTKALLGLAALAASAVTVVAADNVYSLNVVGYVNVPCTNRLTSVANPLNVTPNNAISNVLANVVPGSGAYYFVGGNFNNLATDPFAPTADWGPGAGFDLPPGKGILFDNGGTPQTITFVGEVQQGSSTVVLNPAYSLVSSVVPQAGYIGDLGLVSTPGDYVYMFRGGNWQSIATDPFSPTPAWSSSDTPLFDPVKGPFLNVGEGMFYNNQTANPVNWTRTFNVP
jgi:hypothetical protein